MYIITVIIVSPSLSLYISSTYQKNIFGEKVGRTVAREKIDGENATRQRSSGKFHDFD